MTKERFFELLEAELKDLKHRSMQVKSALVKRQTLAESDNSHELVRRVDDLIDLNLRRVEEARLDEKVEVPEESESTDGKSFPELHRVIDFELGVFPHGRHHASVGNRIVRLRARQATHNALRKDVAAIRRILEKIEQDNYLTSTRVPPHIARELLSTTSSPPSEEKKHKGRKPGSWSRALDDCIAKLGEDVEYQSAATWLEVHQQSAAHEFAERIGASFAKDDVAVLLRHFKEDGNARKRFHKDLNAAKKRFKEKQKMS